MSQNPNGLAPRPALSMQDFMRLLPAELQGASQQQQMEYLRQIAVNGTRQRAQQGQQVSYLFLLQPLCEDPNLKA